MSRVVWILDFSFLWVIADVCFTSLWSDRTTEQKVSHSVFNKRFTENVKKSHLFCWFSHYFPWCLLVTWVDFRNVFWLNFRVCQFIPNLKIRCSHNLLNWTSIHWTAPEKCQAAHLLMETMWQQRWDHQKCVFENHFLGHNCQTDWLTLTWPKPAENHRLSIWIGVTSNSVKPRCHYFTMIGCMFQ